MTLIGKIEAYLLLGCEGFGMSTRTATNPAMSVLILLPMAVCLSTYTVQLPHAPRSFVSNDSQMFCHVVSCFVV